MSYAVGLFTIIQYKPNVFSDIFFENIQKKAHLAQEDIN